MNTELSSRAGIGRDVTVNTINDLSPTDDGCLVSRPTSTHKLSDMWTYETWRCFVLKKEWRDEQVFQLSDTTQYPFQKPVRPRTLYCSVKRHTALHHPDTSAALDLRSSQESVERSCHNWTELKKIMVLFFEFRSKSDRQIDDVTFRWLFDFVRNNRGISEAIHFNDDGSYKKVLWTVLM